MPAETKASILVVDDEPDLRDLYEITLMRAGYGVSTAGSLEEARTQLHRRRFDVLITDMRLPDGMGLDLLPELQAQQRSERVVVITAYGSADNAVHALKTGAFDYLSKPINLDQFRRVVASAVQAGKQAAAAAAPEAPPRSNTAQRTARPASASTPEPAAPASTPAPTSASACANAAYAKKSPSIPKNPYIHVRDASYTPTHAPPQAVAAPAVPQPQADAPEHLNWPPALQDMVGQGMAMQQLKTTLIKVAPSMAPVLVLGESGSGKELVARALHACSHRAQGPFVAVNCGAIPEALLEAEFFGAKKGAYTGSVADREGFFQAANGGTLFLDEIGDLPMPMQAKLLRVIQERQVRPIGAPHEIAVDVRIVSATHKNLADMVQTGNFRQDLYYRLNVIDVRVPPLRERREDIPVLAQALLRRIAMPDAPSAQMTPAFVHTLQTLPWHGNVRELENTLHRCVALSDGHVLDAPLLDDTVMAASMASMPVLADPSIAPPPATVPAAAPWPAAWMGAPSADAAQPAMPVAHTSAPAAALPQSFLQSPPLSAPLLPPLSPTLPPFPPLDVSQGAYQGTYQGTYQGARPPSPLAASAPPPEEPLNLPPLSPPPAPPLAVPHQPLPPTAAEVTLPCDLSTFVDAHEKALLLRALYHTGFNRTAAAALLGLNLRQIRYRMERLGIEGPHGTYADD